MEKAKLIAIAPQLVVPDVVKTAEYYQRVLGFSLLGYFLDPPVYAMLQRDGMQVHFKRSDAGKVRLNNTLSKGSCDLIIWVPQIDLFFREVKALGAEIAQEIITRSYGREFIIVDYDGHRILVCD